MFNGSRRQRPLPIIEKALLDFIAAGTVPATNEQLREIVARHERHIEELRAATETTRAAHDAAHAAELAHIAAGQCLTQRFTEVEAEATHQERQLDARHAELDARETELRAEQAAAADLMRRIRQREGALELNETIADVQARCAQMADKLSQMHDLLDADPVAVRALAAELRGLATRAVTATRAPERPDSVAGAEYGGGSSSAAFCASATFRASVAEQQNRTEVARLMRQRQQARAQTFVAPNGSKIRVAGKAPVKSGSDSDEPDE